MNANDKKVLKTVLNDGSVNVQEEDGEEASRASEALCQVRRMFGGTPFEKTLSDAIIICDTVTAEKVKKTKKTERVCESHCQDGDHGHWILWNYLT